MTGRDVTDSAERLGGGGEVISGGGFSRSKALACSGWVFKAAPAYLGGALGQLKES